MMLNSTLSRVANRGRTRIVTRAWHRQTTRPPVAAMPGNLSATLWPPLPQAAWPTARVPLNAARSLGARTAVGLPLSIALPIVVFLALVGLLVAVAVTLLALPLWLVAQLMGMVAVLAGWTPPSSATALDLELEVLLDTAGAPMASKPQAVDEPPGTPDQTDPMTAALDLANSIGLVDLGLRSGAYQSSSRRHRRRDRDRTHYRHDDDRPDRRVARAIVLLGLGLGLGSCAVMATAAGVSTAGGPKPPSGYDLAAGVAVELANGQQRRTIVIADEVLGPDGGCHQVGERPSLSVGVVDSDDPTLWHWTTPIGWCSDTPADGYSCASPQVVIDDRGVAWAGARPVARCEGAGA